MLSAGWLVLALAWAVAARAEPILAIYGTAAAAKSPPPGWSFLWNAIGTIDDPLGYAPLRYDDTTRTYGIWEATGKMRLHAPAHTISRDNRYLDISAQRDPQGVARFYIASYRLDRDATGDVWINHGNLLNKSFPEGTDVRIYVNVSLRFQFIAQRDRFAHVFQQNLGRLKQGDVIRLAVGPGAKSAKGGGRLTFTIEEYPVGRSPGTPINMLSPPITQAVPQQGADGKIDASYASKHRAQCDAALSSSPSLVFIGDSITARWPAELLQNKFGAFRPANLGIGGDWIQNVHWRVVHGVFETIRPKVIVLLIGTNNISAGFTPDEIVRGIRTILEALQEKTPASKILLLGILPRGDSLKEERNETIRQANATLAALADGRRIFYLDVGDRLVEPDGSISRDVMPDRLHVAGPGYLRWLDAMNPTLNQLLDELR